MELRVVYKEMFKARNNWFDIGLLLGVSKRTLDSIRSQFTKPNEGLRETLAVWRKQGKGASWETLVEVLRSPVIEETQLAARLESRYCVDPQVAVRKQDPQIQRLNKQVKELQTEIHQMKQEFKSRLREKDDQLQEVLAARQSETQQFKRKLKSRDRLLRTKDRTIRKQEEDLAASQIEIETLWQEAQEEEADCRPTTKKRRRNEAMGPLHEPTGGWSNASPSEKLQILKKATAANRTLITESGRVIHLRPDQIMRSNGL